MVGTRRGAVAAGVQERQQVAFRRDRQLGVLGHAPAITEIAGATGVPVPDTANIYFEAGEQLRIADLTAKAATIATTDQYDRLAVVQAVTQLEAAQAAFSIAAIAAGGTGAWRAAQGGQLDRVQATLDEVAGEGTLTLSRLLVAAGQLGEAAASLSAPSASPRKARRPGRATRAPSGSPPARKLASSPRS